MPFGTDYPVPDGWELPPNNVRPLQRSPDAVHRGQVRIAYRLADAFAGRLRHVYGIGWLHWDGKRWVEDHFGKAKLAVLETLRSALAASIEDKALRDDVRKCETAHGIAGVLEIAAALPQFATTVAELDSDPYLLNTATGIYDLRTRELYPHHPRYLCTKITNGGAVTGSRRHEVSDWETFLEQALPDCDVRAYFRRVIGLALFGAVLEHLLAIAIGTGGNGKGVTTGAIEHALGSYAYAAENDLFTSAKANANAASPALMGLRGMRFVTVSETERDQPLAQALVKMVTGGDSITARPLYGRPVTFTPSHLALLVTNHLPKVSGDDEAIWRRIRVIPFNVSFRDHPDTGLGERLRASADDVLAWAIEGWHDYQDGGLAEPESVKVATGAYRQASDALAQFIAEECLRSPHVHVGHSELLGAWRGWCAQAGELPGTERAFSKALEAHGFPARRTTTGKRYGGLALPADDDSDESA